MSATLAEVCWSLLFSLVRLRDARSWFTLGRWRSSLRVADVELLARDAGAVDCGLENLLVCLFLGMTARGRAPVLAVSPKLSRRDTEQQV